VIFVWWMVGIAVCAIALMTPYGEARSSCLSERSRMSQTISKFDSKRSLNSVFHFGGIK
jgi:hypothetical protein